MKLRPHRHLLENPITVLDGAIRAKSRQKIY